MFRACFFHVYLYKQDRIFNVIKTVIVTYSKIYHIESISPCRILYEVVNFINLHTIV